MFFSYIVIFFGIPIIILIFFLVKAEITRPKPSKEQKSKYKRILDEYKSNGYETYFTSIQTPELFFIYADKGIDVNNATRPNERIYIDCEREVAFMSRSLNERMRKYVDPPIAFEIFKS